MSIKNIEQLRNAGLEILDQLKSKSINPAEAGITAKIFETIMTSVRLQMEYSSQLKEIPHIPFLQSCHKSQGNMFDATPVKPKLSYNKKVKRLKHDTRK